MEVTIDKAGRIVVPKPVRDRFGLKKDSKLELVEDSEAIVLKPMEKRSGLSRRPNGRLVITNRAPERIDWDHLVDDVREKRIREIAGR